ncbi:hypothetical protein V1514DRAFT_330940 [Lipomyces japonicus]|uniref:uncharacterized protein n=1 Tax=Lipomyces japonicus TaxID=56871 RepID=UPI0034D01D77
MYTKKTSLPHFHKYKAHRQSVIHLYRNFVRHSLKLIHKTRTNGPVSTGDDADDRPFNLADAKLMYGRIRYQFRKNNKKANLSEIGLYWELVKAHNTEKILRQAATAVDPQSSVTAIRQIARTIHLIKDKSNYHAFKPQVKKPLKPDREELRRKSIIGRHRGGVMFLNEHMTKEEADEIGWQRFVERDELLKARKKSYAKMRVPIPRVITIAAQAKFFVIRKPWGVGQREAERARSEINKQQRLFDWNNLISSFLFYSHIEDMFEQKMNILSSANEPTWENSIMVERNRLNKIFESYPKQGHLHLEQARKRAEVLRRQMVRSHPRFNDMFKFSKEYLEQEAAELD